MAIPLSLGQPAGEPRKLPASHALARMGRAVRSNRKATVGTVLLALFILVALFPGVIAHDNPSLDAYKPHLGVSTAHLLGTTAYGQDMFAQLVWGTRNVMIIAFTVGLATTGIAVLVGVAGRSQGRVCAADERGRSCDLRRSAWCRPRNRQRRCSGPAPVYRGTSGR